MITLTEQQLRNFWNKVDKSGNCWIWTAKKDKWGYGQVGISYKSYLAHRISFMIANGYMPENMVLHSCDNRACVNPLHLSEGTNQDNMIDMAKKGRHPKQKLTPKKVLAIRAMRGSQREIAKQYSVSQPTISKIQNKRKWAWLPEAE